MFPSAERKIPSSGAVTATLITAGEGRASQVCVSRLWGDPPSAEAEGVFFAPLSSFVPPGFPRPGGTGSQIHINGGGEEEHTLISR